MTSGAFQLDLSFLLSRAAQRRIAALTVACALAGVAYALLAPRWYRSTLTVVPAKSQRSNSLSSILGGEAAGLAAGFLDGAGGGADAARVTAVLQSNSVSDAVIEKLALKARYGVTYQENAREELWRHCDVKVLPKPQLVQLSCEDRDPAFVQQLLAFFADFGNETFRKVSVSSASEEVRFLEKHVAELRTLADDSAARMREFQETHRIVDLDSQAKAVVSSLATLNNERIGKLLELEYARTFSAHDEPSLRQLRSQLSVLADRLRELEEAPRPQPAADPPPASRRAGQNAMFPAALEVPRLRADFEKLYRDRRVAEATLVFALERLEGAKANEARDVSTFLVLDPPARPDKPARPRRLQSVALAALAGLLAALGLELARHRLSTARRERRIAAAPEITPARDASGTR